MKKYNHLKPHLEKLATRHVISEETLEDIQTIMARYAYQAMTSPGVAKEAKKVLQDHFVECIRRHNETHCIEI